ncbi:MAG: hypothetical protein WD044_13830 [Dongiaceae bacterium]
MKTSFAEQDCRTTLTVLAAAPNAPEVERKTAEAGFDSVMQGFSATFDQPDEFLKPAQR